MYYLGTPFVDSKRKELFEVLNEECIYIDINETVDFADKIIERKVNNLVDYVFYTNANWKDKRLLAYHKEKYNNLIFFIEEYLSKNVYKLTSIENNQVLSYKITHYLDDWRIKIELSFNFNHEMIEYRELYYRDDAQTPFEENIFFSLNWTVHKEKYL